jgi:uncharacterized membrane protein YhfC
VNILYLTHLLNALLMIAIPVGLGVYLTRKFRLDWRLWWIGGVVFILSQVGHLPFNLLLLNPFLQGPITFGLSPRLAVLLNALALGLSAGLFEELSRYAAYRWWAKDARSWSRGLLLGAGHGGMEAIILGVLALYTYIRLVAVRNADLSLLVPMEQLDLARQQVQAYWSLPWYFSLFGALERAFTIPFHIAASLLVLQAFTRRQLRWLWLAVAWHALVDGLAVYGISYWGAYTTEIAIGVVALASLAIIFALRQPEPPQLEESLPPLEPVKSMPPLQIEETTENLEQTRYQ